MKQSKLFAFLVFFSSLVLVACESEEAYEIGDNKSQRQSNLVTLNEARGELEQLLTDVYNTPTTRGRHKAKKTIANAFTIDEGQHSARSSEAQTPVVHVFNFSDNEGFAIMAGNREMPSLLALADSGTILQSEAIDNPGFAIFLENLEDKYDDALSVSTQKANTTTEYGEWQNVVYKESGYCKVKWGQGYPHNNYCPLKDGKRTLTGCVATAVAQLMSIYQYPTSHNEYSYDWDAMTAKALAPYCTNEAQNQIARLMIELGNKSNLDMDYGLKRSRANAENVPRTLKNFGYSNGGRLIDYKTSSVVSELQNGYSVLVGGFAKRKKHKVLGINFKTTYSEGHQWLCHGLLERRRNVKTYNSTGTLLSSSTESEWYVLCNWGGGGLYDGYYLSKAFNIGKGPVYNDDAQAANNGSGKDYSYKYNNKAIIGIRK